MKKNFLKKLQAVFLLSAIALAGAAFMPAETQAQSGLCDDLLPNCGGGPRICDALVGPSNGGLTICYWFLQCV